LLFGLVVWTFLPALRGEFIEFDDYAYVTGNAHIFFTPANLTFALTRGVAANWHPLTQWSLMLDHRLYGFNPWGYHLTNVLLHAANTVLLFLVFRRLTGATWRSLAVAALFGLHPLRVESVAWISERKDVLSVLFWLLSLWAYARYAQRVTSNKCQFSRTGSTPLPFPGDLSLFYWLALLSFALGLMSKPMLVTLPAVLLLLDFWPLNRWPQEHWSGLLVEKFPFFLLSACVSVITFVVQRNSGMMHELIGVELPFGLRLENAAVSFARYLSKLFWPADLCALYPHPGRWPLAVVLLSVSLVLGLSVLAFVWRRQRPYLFTGWFWYLGTLVPVIGLIQVGAQSIADRYSYIPTVGLLLLVVWEAHQLTVGWRFQRLALGTVGGVLGLSCLLLTRHQLTFWRDGVSLWQRAVAVTTNNYDAHNRLGRALYAQGRFDESIREQLEAIRLNPDLAEAYCILGRTCEAKGQADDAIAWYQKALAIWPAYVTVHNNLAILLLRLGRVEAALVQSQLALASEPNNVTALDTLGLALLQKGRADEALAHLQRAVDLEPDNEMALLNLGSAFSQLGRNDEAIHCLRLALKLQPNSAETHNNLGGALLAKGQIPDAVQEFRMAAFLQPDRYEARRNLGHALLKQGSIDEAIREFQAALSLQPNNALASNDLVFALALKGKPAASPTNSIPP